MGMAIHWSKVSFAVLVFLTSIAPAQSDAQDSLIFIGDVRVRYDYIDQENIPEHGEALTVSSRLGLEWRWTERISALVEFEAVGALIDDFQETPMPPRQRPFLPDPDHLDLNRLQVQAKLTERSFLTVGRQSLRIDDQRFLGAAPFRQNSRSYDAVRLSARSSDAHTVQVGYIGKVNRPLGNRTPLGEFDSDSWFATTNLQTPVGRVGVFHYALDLETGANWNRNRSLSSVTTGIRYDGRFHAAALKIDVEGSYAQQQSYADNPLSYRADYWLADVRSFHGPLELAVRHERLGAGREQSFQTPLASLHKFHGEGDLFLTTPPDGLVDTAISARYNGGNLGLFSDITTTARFHHFQSDRGAIEYGNELDFVVRANLKKLNLTLGLANYEADQFSADQQRLFLSIGKRF